MYNNKLIAIAIRDRRLQLNYTQEYIASQLNMSQNAYSKLELGQTKVTLERFIQLCDILETEMLELLKPCLQVA
ncbi:helix-turn-helix domain-containing protein [Mucilaginibacter pedocola]|uniref:HTH cro/C1-type domain-containing protein n=1 Tax=Mucilaginibacter pedocola TaxID=1792845 RepID=A0A1S9PK68_9SPHI|nr:hypothetical protein BC343_20450 [Mucilaginibacter pedocola]